MANNPAGAGNRYRGWLYTGVKGFAVIIVTVAIYLGLRYAPPIWRWALVAGLMVIALLAAGFWGTTWGWLGALVDPQRGKYSLGQLQVVLWTLVIISSWCAIVVTRIVLRVPDGSEVDQLVTEIAESHQQVEDALAGIDARDQLEDLIAQKSSLLQSDKKAEDLKRILDAEQDLDAPLVDEITGLLDEITERERQLRALLEADVTYADALNVEIPTEVLILLGISGVSLVGGAVIKNDKGPAAARRGKQPTLDTGNAQLQSSLLAAGASGEAARKGLSWLDIFKGDQQGDQAYIDIGKFQMFWFTAAALVAYSMQIATLIDMATSNEVLEMVGLTGTQMSRLGFALVTSLPAVSASLAGVLAISHGAYLANKVPDRPAAGGVGGAPQGLPQEMIKIVSLEVGTIDATGAFQAAGQISGADKVAVQVQPQSSATSSAVTAAKVFVELRSSAGPVEMVQIDMAGKITNLGMSSAPLVAGDWQAVVVVAAADGFVGLDPASGNLTKAFKVV